MAGQYRFVQLGRYSFTFQQHSSCMYQCAQHSSTTAAQTSFLLSFGPKQARAELNWLEDLGSLQQREYELQVNKI